MLLAQTPAQLLNLCLKVPQLPLLALEQLNPPQQVAVLGPEGLGELRSGLDLGPAGLLLRGERLSQAGLEPLELALHRLAARLLSQRPQIPDGGQVGLIHLLKVLLERYANLADFTQINFRLALLRLRLLGLQLQSQLVHLVL